MEKLTLFNHPFFDKKTILVSLTAFAVGGLCVAIFYSYSLPNERREAFDQGFRSGQWNGYYYSGNLEDAAAAQVRMQDLGEWEG